MELFKFLKKESGAFGYLFVFLGILSGLANAGLLKLINTVISELTRPNEKYKLEIKSIVFYLVVVFVLIFSQRIFSKYIITLTQKIICKIQLEILEKIRLSDYSNFKNIGRERIYTSLTQDAGNISSAAASIVYACTSLVTVIFCLIYLAYISLLGFGLTLLVIGIAVTIYMFRQKAIEGGLIKARELQNTFFKLINDLLSGYKEMKVNHKKSDDLYKNYIEKTSVKARDLSTKAIVSYLDNSLTGQLSFFLLIGFILFCFPLFVSNHQVVVSYIFIILYILGPIEGLMTTIPGITQANIAIRNIRVLQEQTTSLTNLSSENNSDHPSFDKIIFDQVEFSYERR
jgi:putative pyoverdin transport system ATP-binding/permease protein